MILTVNVMRAGVVAWSLCVLTYIPMYIYYPGESRELAHESSETSKHKTSVVLPSLPLQATASISTTTDTSNSSATGVRPTTTTA
jgi:hypothetical protein